MFNKQWAFIIRSQASILIEKPLETVALYVTDHEHFRQWNPGILIKHSKNTSFNELEISHYLPFKMISVVEKEKKKWIERTLVFDPINAHKTNLILLERHKQNGILSLLFFPLSKVVILKQMKKRLTELKIQIEDIKFQKSFPQHTSLWAAKPFPRLLKESPRFY